MDFLNLTTHLDVVTDVCTAVGAVFLAASALARTLEVLAKILHTAAVKLTPRYDEDDKLAVSLINGSHACALFLDKVAAVVVAPLKFTAGRKNK